MRFGCDEVGLAIAKRLVGAARRRDQFDRNVEPFALEKAKLGGRNHGKI